MSHIAYDLRMVYCLGLSHKKVLPSDGWKCYDNAPEAQHFADVLPKEITLILYKSDIDLWPLLYYNNGYSTDKGDEIYQYKKQRDYFRGGN